MRCGSTVSDVPRSAKYLMMLVIVDGMSTSNTCYMHAIVAS